MRDYRGHKVLLHTGGLPGYVSRVVMLPDLKLGVAVLTNQESGGAFDAIAFHILDHYLGAPAYDWIDGYRTIEARATAAGTAAEAEAARVTTAARPAARSSWRSTPAAIATPGTATSRSPGKADGLVMRFSHTPALVGDLVHFQHDTFIVRWRDRELRADAYVTFALNPDGTIDQAKMRAVSPETDFSFDFQDLLLKPVPAAAR